MAKQKENTPSSPYLAARREWNEQYGSYLSSAKTWKNIAMVSLLLATVSVLGVVYFASQNKLIPYVIEVDGKGRTVQVYPVSKAKTGNPNLIRAQLAQFIMDVRSVTADKNLQVQHIKRAYTHLNSNMAAYGYINTYFKRNAPFEVAKSKTVAIDIQQVLPLTDKTWRVEWQETTYARNGAEKSKHQMTGTATVLETGNVNNQTILLNPTGLLIQEINWSRDL